MLVSTRIVVQYSSRKVVYTLHAAVLGLAQKKENTLSVIIASSKVILLC